MVDERDILKQYSYKATSNLVIEQNRSRRKDDAAGVSALQAGSLPGRMGDKLRHSTPAPENKPSSKPQRQRQRPTPPPPRDDSAPLRSNAVPVDVVDVADDLQIDAEGSAYVPSNAVSQRAFEALLAFITSKLGDQPRDLLRSAAYEILALLKDPTLVELDRKKQIESLLAPMTPDEFSRLSLLGRQISDYDQTASIANQPQSNPTNSLHPSDHVHPIGVSVVYDADEKNSDDPEDINDIDIDIVENNPDVDPILDPNLPISDLPEDLDQPVLSRQDDCQQPFSISLDPRDVDLKWVQVRLAEFYPNPQECENISQQVLDILFSPVDDHACEHSLVKLLKFDKFDFLAMLIDNRQAILWAYRIRRANSVEEAALIRNEMENCEPGKVLLPLLFPSSDDARMPNPFQHNNDTAIESKTVALSEDPERNPKDAVSGRRRPKFSLRTIDLENLAFQRGANVMTARNCELPEGSQHIEQKDYEEWHIPASRVVNHSSEIALVPIAQLPAWAQLAFAGTSELNRVQSTVYPCAFGSDENMLLCAPTGAGKTNVAMLAILRALQKSASGDVSLLNKGKFNRSSFKVVYVAPMKALVSEVVGNLSRRLEPLQIQVGELTGDVGMSSRDIARTQVIVTTPEKWDIITRKSSEKTFTRLVKLLIIDEIHLLHDERGPVLEALVARTLRDIDSVSTTTRIVGLSATLPNYKDVAAFLRVESSGLFFFGSAYRPCPLQQCYVGITTKKALKRFQLMNDITYEKVKEQLQTSKQVIIFVHSRKETVSTGQVLIDKAIEDEEIDIFIKPGSESSEIINSELSAISSKDLASLLQHGVAVHHAGMTRGDRSLVEALFEARHVKVLVSTATLAWGVNLPAHAVILKGTQVYSPEHGRWIQLSSMDVMQMMGRAGRPQFDKYGEGIIITTKADVLYYLSLLNNQLPIESQLVSRLIDMLNAEIANGSVTSIVEGSHWLSFTYLYIRMLRSPILYGISADEHEADSILERRRAELIHSAASQLQDAGLVRYNKNTGDIQSTDIGRVAADFYVNHTSMASYLEKMKVCSSDIDLLRVFSSSGEFRHMHVREEEKLELARLSERVPIPIKESLGEPTTKVNVLLQAFISNLALDGLALRADMIYVTQSAARLSRALLHISVLMKSALLVEKCLVLCKSVGARQWSTQTPLRQFPTLGRDVVHRIERKDYPFERYYDLNVSELGELLKNSKLGKNVHRLVHTLPRIEMDAQVRPLSRSIVEVELTLLPDFRFDRKYHGSGELFWITAEDADSERIIHVESFFLKAAFASVEHVLCFTLQLSTPSPPQYFIRCRNDRWIVPETVLPISFRNMILPEKFASYSQLQDSLLLSVDEAFEPFFGRNDVEDMQETAVRREALSQAKHHFGSRFKFFSPMQSQLFPCLFDSDEDAVIASVPDLERDVCIELSIARLFVDSPAAVALWVVGKGSIAVDRACNVLKSGIGNAMSLSVGKFMSDRGEGLSLLRTSGSIVVTTAQQWDKFSRRWREKRVGKIFKKLGLVVLDSIHALGFGTGSGASLEVMASRMRYISSEARENGETPFRILAVSDPVANAREVGHWLGCTPSSVFSFHPNDTSRGFKLDVVGITNGDFHDTSIVLATQPLLGAMRRHIGDRNHRVIVYVSSRKAACILALELISLATLQEGNFKNVFKAIEEDDDDLKAVLNSALRDCLAQGVGFLHEGLGSIDRETVENMFRADKIRFLICTPRFAWESNDLTCKLVVIAGTRNHGQGYVSTRRNEYSRMDLMKMMFGCRDMLSSGKRVAVILTGSAMKEYYKKCSLEPLPIESQLPRWLPDHLNAEIASGVIASKQDAVDYLTWTFFYRRLPKNANYYGMKGVSNLDISNHLSEMVEGALSDLEASKCVASEGDDDVALGPLNLGIIASHYYLSYSTMEYFASSISSSSKHRHLLDILSMASEFDVIGVRQGEEETLQELALDSRVSLPSNDGPPSFSDAHVKAHLLLQAQMSRQHLTEQLREDRDIAVVVGVQLLKAMVDVISSAGWLRPAIAAIELSQMIVQGIWDNNLILMQLPYITFERASKSRDNFNVSDIFGFLEMEDEDRNDVLSGLSTEEVAEIANACQQFPNLQDIEIEQVTESIDEDGSSITKMVVIVKRDEEDMGNEDGDAAAGSRGKVPEVIAPRFPETKEEGWWVIVGDNASNRVITVKHLTLKKESRVKLEFATPPKTGPTALKVFLMSDSYIDCDQEETFVMY